MNPRPIEVRPLSNYELEIKFANGEIRIFDMKPHLEFGIFTELKNPSYFGLVRIENGTVCWPNEQDICPDTLFLDSYFVKRDGAA
jgi:hypothetical protein